MKKCESCNIEKHLTEYDSVQYKTKKSNEIKIYYRNICKNCRRLKDVEYNKINRERKNIYNKEYGLFNKEKISKNKRKYYLNNRQKIRDSKRIYMRKRRAEDPLFKLKDSIIGLIYHSIKKQGYKKNSKTENILGCSYETFKSFIENKFQDGMTWENKGEWHLDHIIPISSATNEKEVYELNNYKNFQPLWSIDNLIKSNKY
jgi:hypothetical protein